MRDSQNDLAILKDFEARLEELMGLIPQDGRLPPALKARLQVSYASLKTDMRKVAKQDTAVGAVVAEALCRMRSATNTHPIRSNWFDGLYAARCDVRHAIHSRQRQ
jgi:hypothetical protein